MELRIIRDRIPGLATFLIGSGPQDSVFAQYFSREGIKEIGLFGFWSMMVFLAVLTIGFIYEWKKGALEWD